MTSIRVLSVASEIYPLIKTGGLADVAGALPAALAAEGVAVQSLVPGYPSVLRAVGSLEAVYRFDDLFGGSARLLRGLAHGLELLVLEAPHLFDRPGGPYADAGGSDWPDNAFRFAALAWAAASIGSGDVAVHRPDVVHAHDWQAGLAPAYVHYGGRPRPATVMTVHNLAFQGAYPAGLLSALRLPAASYAIDGVEYHGAIGFLKAGLQLADRITTVSPTYAAEICTPEAGMGLDGLLRHRAGALSGILNGIDTSVWNPATDPRIASRYGPADVAARAVNKTALQRRFGLAEDSSAPLFGVISRLSWQKGLDLLLDAIPMLCGQGAQLVVLGAGDRPLEDGYGSAATQHASQVGCVIGYDEDLAHLIQAGSDAILVPSRFEPCGLTQLCALRYGAVPVVARVGGLADTVIDASEMALAAGVATGVQFSPVSRPMLEAAIRRAINLYRDPDSWSRMCRNGMSTDVSWRNPAKRYAQLYRSLLDSRA